MLLNIFMKKKIIHRNINLDNILLHYDNEEDKNNLNLIKAQIKIIDLGFSCTIIDNELKYIIGNPVRSFLFICGRCDNDMTEKLGNNESADIWSIGSICYEMLMGKPVYNVEENIEKVEKGIILIPNNISYELVSFLMECFNIMQKID